MKVTIREILNELDDNHKKVIQDLIEDKSPKSVRVFINYDSKNSIQQF